MNMFKDAARKNAEAAAQQIAADHDNAKALAAVASDAADQLMNYLVDHPALEVIEIGTHVNVVNLHKLQTGRSLQILCGDADVFSLVEGRPPEQRLVTSGMPHPVNTNPLNKQQMTKEVLKWIA